MQGRTKSTKRQMISETRPIIEPFVCKRCLDVISRPKHFSKDPKLCIYCYERDQAMKNNKCLNCGGVNPVVEYWAVCKKCWDKSIKEIEEENQKLFKQEAKELGITLEEYKRRMMEEL